MWTEVNNNAKLYCYPYNDNLVLIDYFNDWIYEYSLEYLSVIFYRNGQNVGEYQDGYGYLHLKDVFSKYSIVGTNNVVEWAYDYLDKMEEVVVELLGSQEEVDRFFGNG